MRRRPGLLVAVGLLAPACSSPAPAVRSRSSAASAPMPDAADAAGPVDEGLVTSVAGPAPTTTEPVPVVTFTVPTTPPVTTTLVLPEKADEGLTDAEWWASQPGATPPEWVKQRESRGNYSAVNPTTGAGGAWQFLPSTWRSVGGTGRAENASAAEQDFRAALLWDGGRGCAHWNACS